MKGGKGVLMQALGPLRAGIEGTAEWLFKFEKQERFIPSANNGVMECLGHISRASHFHRLAHLGCGDPKGGRLMS